MLVKREWCNGKKHVIIVPFLHKPKLAAGFSLQLNCFSKPFSDKTYFKKCVPWCSYFLKNGVDDCGFLASTVVEPCKKGR